MAALSVISGLSLVVLALAKVSSTLRWQLLTLFVLLGAAALWGAVNYTAGKRPYGYAGLGDLAVLLFFGWLGVLGTYFLQAGQLPWSVWLPATSIGLFAVAVLNVNNIRDIASDRQAGKYSIPVRIGRNNAIRYHWGLLGTGILCALLFVLLEYRSPWQYLFITTLPLFVRNGVAVSTTPPESLDPYLKQMALATLAFMLSFGLGHLLA